jgi:hypothetical protein
VKDGISSMGRFADLLGYHNEHALRMTDEKNGALISVMKSLLDTAGLVRWRSFS